MTQSSLKYYPRDDFDPKKLQETLFSHFVDFDLCEELVLYPIRQFFKDSFQARTTGDTLIDFSLTDVFLTQLLTNGFKHINILRASDYSIADLKKWMKKEQAASVTSQIVAALDGSSDWEEKEESLRKKNPQILKWDTKKGDPTKPVELEEADCFLCMFILDLISRHRDDFNSNIIKIASMLGVGKRFFYCGLVNCTLFTVGDVVVHIIPHYETTVKEALLEAGILVLSIELKQRELNVRSKVLKYDYVYFIDAIKFSDDMTISE